MPIGHEPGTTRLLALWICWQSIPPSESPSFPQAPAPRVSRQPILGRLDEDLERPLLTYIRSISATGAIVERVSDTAMIKPPELTHLIGLSKRRFPEQQLIDLISAGCSAIAGENGSEPTWGRTPFSFRRHQQAGASPPLIRDRSRRTTRKFRPEPRPQDGPLGGVVRRNESAMVGSGRTRQALQDVIS